MPHAIYLPPEHVLDISVKWHVGLVMPGMFHLIPSNQMTILQLSCSNTASCHDNDYAHLPLPPGFNLRYHSGNRHSTIDIKETS